MSSLGPPPPSDEVSRIPGLIDANTIIASDEFSQTVSGNARFWLTFVAESKLRVENLRIVHRLALSTPDFKGTTILPKIDKKVISESSPSYSLPNKCGDVLEEMKSKGQEQPAYHETLQHTVDPIKRLSDDILISVLSYLSYPELISAQRVSKGWLHYLTTVPYIHRKVSFLNSKHQITLKTLRAVLSMANGHISSLEFDADTLLYLTPLVPIYPHLQRLIIEHKNGVMSTIFNIAFQLPNDIYHNLPSLRTAVFHRGMLLNNEIVMLMTMAPNLEELECYRAVTWLDRLELMNACKIKRLRIEGYSERLASRARDIRFPVSRSPLILQYLPDLEELVLGLDSLLIMDLTMNPNIRYLDFLPGSPVVSFIQPPRNLEICLNAPQLCGFSFDTETPVVSQSDQGDRRLQLWKNPPPFKSLSIGLVRPAGLPRALCNSYESLVSLAVSFGPPHDFLGWIRATPYPETRKLRFMETLIDVLGLFQNLRFLDLSTTTIDDSVLLRLPNLPLEYLSLAHTLVTTDGVIQFLSKIPMVLKGLNLVGTAVGVEVTKVAQKLSVEIETEYPGKSLPGTLYSLY